MPHFLICIHDATPAYARATEQLLRGLAPLVGRRLALGVVPAWHGSWPLAAHREYCRLLQGASDELLLHGYSHRRQRGSGPVSWLAERCDEFSGLDREEAGTLLERGQLAFADVFGQRARGFLAPGWQEGGARGEHVKRAGLEYRLGYFAVETAGGEAVPLATWTWDCGRWAWLGRIGHAAGRALHLAGSGVASLAIHPRDIERGFWPAILDLTKRLLDTGHAPATPGALLRQADAEIAV